MDRAEVVVIAGCPPAEELAEFLEGRLTGARRDAVVRHLADCDDCRAVYLGAAGFAQMEAETTEATVAPVVSIDRKRGGPGGTRLWSYAAAACLGVMLAGVVFRLSQPSSAPTPTAALLALAGSDGPPEPICSSCTLRPTHRGEERLATDSVVAAFWAGRAWGETFGLVRDGKLPEANKAYGAFVDQVGAIEADFRLDPVPPERLPATPEELTTLEESWLPAIRSLDSDGYWELDLGRWVAAADRAAALGNATFFAPDGAAMKVLRNLPLPEDAQLKLLESGSRAQWVNSQYSLRDGE